MYSLKGQKKSVENSRFLNFFCKQYTINKQNFSLSVISGMQPRSLYPFYLCQIILPLLFLTSCAHTLNYAVLESCHEGSASFQSHRNHPLAMTVPLLRYFATPGAILINFLGKGSQIQALKRSHQCRE